MHGVWLCNQKQGFETSKFDDVISTSYFVHNTEGSAVTFDRHTTCTCEPLANSDAMQKAPLVSQPHGRDALSCGGLKTSKLIADLLHNGELRGCSLTAAGSSLTHSHKLGIVEGVYTCGRVEAMGALLACREANFSHYYTGPVLVQHVYGN